MRVLGKSGQMYRFDGEAVFNARRAWLTDVRGQVGGIRITRAGGLLESRQGEWLLTGRMALAPVDGREAWKLIGTPRYVVRGLDRHSAETEIIFSGEEFRMGGIVLRTCSGTVFVRSDGVSRGGLACRFLGEQSEVTVRGRPGGTVHWSLDVESFPACRLAELAAAGPGKEFLEALSGSVALSVNGFFHAAGTVSGRSAAVTELAFAPSLLAGDRGRVSVPLRGGKRLLRPDRKLRALGR